eukprot:gene11430-17116_t
MEPAQSVSVEQVHATILAAISIDAPARESAENLLRNWEADAAPGFISSLLKIVEHTAIDEPNRLLAAVIAKNAVGSSWRKTLGTREWSKVPEEEKTQVKNVAYNLLINDTSDRVAVQLGVLITNIARFDFPGRSENILNQLLEASKPESQLHVTSRMRALKTLRTVLKGLKTKKFVIESGKEGVQVFAKSAISAVADMLGLSPLADQLHPGTQQLLELVHKTCTFITAGPPQGANLDAQQAALWLDLGGKMYERMARSQKYSFAAFSYLMCDSIPGPLTPIPFAEFVPHFLSLFVEGGVVSLDAATVRAMRPKRRVLLIRFIAKALLNPFYRPEWLEAAMPAGVLANRSKAHMAYKALNRMLAPPSEGGQCHLLAEVLANRSKAHMAYKALNRMLAPPSEGGQCHLLVEALISKYVALTPEELEEWHSDPESYARSMDVESGPDADTPRPIGVGLLLCMLERGGQPVVQALIGLAGSLQQVQPPTAEAVLMREACYRCIGEGYSHVSSHINFQHWYENELSAQLVARLPDFLAGRQDLIASVLQWCSAYKLVEKHMGSKDLVVALTAVSSAMALTALILDDQASLEQIQAASKPKAGMPNLSEVLQLRESAEAEVAAAQEENAGAVAETTARVEGRLSALSDSMVDALNHCFNLLVRLSEVESMVRALQLVSVLVEAMGDQIRPHLGLIAGALPQDLGKTRRPHHLQQGDKGS